jgi:tripartite-type tricarboxylate transporter receptor subunit TctC
VVRAPCSLTWSAGRFRWHSTTYRHPSSTSERVSYARLAVATTTPSEALPNIPTVADFLPGYEASAWGGLGAPKDTPAEIIHKLNKEINAALGDPRIKARIAELGATAFPTSPNEFGRFIGEETEKWGKVIRAANIKLE